MTTLTLEWTRPESYQVHIEPGLFQRLGELTRAVAPHRQVILLQDAVAASYHGRQVFQSLQRAYDGDDSVIEYQLPAGESAKTLATVAELYSLFAAHRVERGCPVVSLGGGATGDTAGFAAASYLRGLPFIQCPTTLLAMVDASVGGKVGVNLPAGKNLVGAFHQPRLVVIDPDTLATLPGEELACGLAECVKHAVIRDPELFDFIKDNLDDITKLKPSVVVELIARNVRIKADVVQEDEKEAGQRTHLNFGHTFAHALEAVDQYKNRRHGEAVALGMIAATRLAVSEGLCDPSLVVQLTDLLDGIGLPTREPNLPDIEDLIEAMRQDKKNRDGQIHFVLPRRLGTVVGNYVVSKERAVENETIRTAWESLRT